MLTVTTFPRHHNLYRLIVVHTNTGLVAAVKQKLGKQVTAVSPLKASASRAAHSGFDSLSLRRDFFPGGVIPAP